ncbi:MAG: RNA 2',3'-cyclic phosphodiesterase [Patescibacteria group bacterium]|nr:RNA 2',3'-cyclic phosphodiesterase [Patescibacteria group bacterium]
MRVFLAIDILRKNRETLLETQSKIRKAVICGGNIRWLQVNALHLTVVFVGELEREGLACLENAVATAVSGVDPFTIRFSKVECFPTSRKPRVIVLNAGKGFAEFRKLQKAVSKSLREAGVKHADPNPPHITLARVKTGPVHIPDDFEVAPFSLGVGTIVLKKSTLLPKGAEYTTLAEFQLGI